MGGHGLNRHAVPLCLLTLQSESAATTTFSKQRWRPFSVFFFYLVVQVFFFYTVGSRSQEHIDNANIWTEDQDWQQHDHGYQQQGI